MSRPNVIVVMADDMGFGDFGCFSEGRVHTPALDQLVAEGVCCSQHYAASAVCTPSRAGFLTGRYPHRTGAIDMRESRGLDRLHLRERTMADVFRSAGYATGLVGKWHNGAVGAEYHPNQRGFDEFTGFRHGLMDYYDWRMERNGSPFISDGCYLTDVLAAEANDFIRRHRQEPFFLYLAYNAPHTPLQAPEEDLRPYTESGRFTKEQALVYAMISRLDRALASLRDTLVEQGIDDNTLLIFTSDNGPNLDHRMERFNAHLREGKMHVYEGGIRLPMVVRWPDGMERNGDFHGLVHSCDLLPTLLTACGIEDESPLPLDGVDVWSALRDNSPQAEQPLRFWQWNRYGPEVACNAAAREGNWKLVRPVIPEAMETDAEEMAIDRRLLNEPESFNPYWLTAPMPERTLSAPSKPELYNLANDPGEQQNLAANYPEIVDGLMLKLQNWFDDVEGERRAHASATVS
ncbi:sulfatase-like hydrolase/transferase [Cerasicoccus frondis]|uniref:sulfatase-like hydrolase/transferase n=1 Tax=Cerasicoccus frondis TaxID=490090 RepID=UPI00285250A6|nr:sulfatase-like hydrolase/transferase [Cerasicoccus frondis]